MSQLDIVLLSYERTVQVQVGYKYCKSTKYLWLGLPLSHLYEKVEGNYLSSQCVDYSGVAEHHCHRRQQVCEKNDRRQDAFLCSVAGVCTPWYTRSLDDVSARRTDNCHECWYHDPNDHDCRIHQALLNLELQKRKINYLLQKL